MWRVAALVLCLAAPAPGPAGAQQDTLEAIGEVSDRLRYHYRTGTRLGLSGRSRISTDLDRYCDGGAGALCHGGDPDRGYCPRGVPCHPTEEFLVEGLLAVATEYPQSGLAMGQAIYALTKFGRLSEASDLLDTCTAGGWWCEALEGYLLLSMGKGPEAEAAFRGGMTGAPAATRCSWGDALWLLGEWDQRRGNVDLLPDSRERTSEWSCAKRLAASDTIWWLADPLFSDEGNDRWAEHIARAMEAQFAAEISRAVRGSEVPERYLEYDWAMRVRRGVWDSFEIPPGGSGPRYWTSQEQAFYHFVPNVSPGDLSDPTWRLEGTILTEGFSPGYGPFRLMPVQFARFRSGVSLRIAVAGDLMASPLRRATEAEAHFVLSDGPGSVPLHLRKDVRRTNPVLLGEAPARDYVAGFEVLTEIGVGWDRRRITPLRSTGAELSDLLLFGPSEGAEPESMEEAATTMLGSANLERGGRLGIFWETYDAPEGTMLEFILTLERDPGRLVDKLTALFSGGSQEGRGRVRWTEPGTGGIHPRSLTLDLSDLDSGDYTLVLSVQWPGQSPVERRRSISVQ